MRGRLLAPPQLEPLYDHVLRPAEALVCSGRHGRTRNSPRNIA